MTTTSKTQDVPPAAPKSNLESAYKARQIAQEAEDNLKIKIDEAILHLWRCREAADDGIGDAEAIEQAEKELEALLIALKSAWGEVLAAESQVAIAQKAAGVTPNDRKREIVAHILERNAQNA